MLINFHLTSKESRAQSNLFSNSISAALHITVSRASPSRLGLRPRCSGFALAVRCALAARCMNLYYNLYKKWTNCMNLYYTICITKCTNYMNSYVWKNQVGISTRDQYGLQSSQRHTIHPPTSSMGAHFIYIPYNKKTIRKTRLYKFIRVAYSHPLLVDMTDIHGLTIRLWFLCPDSKFTYGYMDK